jgi:hypothetical protein
MSDRLLPEEVEDMEEVMELYPAPTLRAKPLRVLSVPVSIRARSAR